jgi:glutamate/tyrosine decarboxylase-like PLP-dependent enzyme
MTTTLPKQGRDWQDIKVDMIQRGTGDAKWRDGKTAVYVFNAGEDVARVQREAYTLYMSENGLGPLAFPSLAQMEQEVCEIALNLLSAPEGAKGAITSGGTDSITMAIKAARDYARANGNQPALANIVIPKSAHPAFNKASHLMDLEVRRIPVRNTDYTADVEAMAAAIDDATIMLVGSAPNFPHGIIDPISELGTLAEQRNTWLHVDACVGGYIAPFARMNGVELPDFDFAVAGVQSMSADLHKFGYAAKGASTVLFRSADLYAHMPFDESDWSGARMITPTLAGTRPGGAIAAAWAIMQFLGEDGYRELQGRVCETRERIAAAVTAMGFAVLGSPKLSLIAFAHPDYDSMKLWAKLYERGWVTSVTIEPPSLHLMLSPKHAEVADTYLSDLQWAMQEVDAGRDGASREARYS